jgi:SNF2 family DNA or RNA helicase
LISALQYSLQNSILIGSKEDIKCLGGIAVEPYVHQVESLKQFLNNFPQRMMLLDEVGLGKTISAGLILAELIRRRRISNFLVVCPAILVDQWHQELTEKFRFRDLRAGNWQRIRPWISREPETLRVITTYNAVVNHREVFLNRKWDFVIADEGDYLKTLYSANGLEPSVRARTFYDLLKEGRADFFLLLTATPLRKNLWDVFNLTELTCQPGVNPIGTPQSFKRIFIADDPTTARRIRESQQGEFRRRLTQLAVRNSRREQKSLMFPARRVAHFAIPLSDANNGGRCNFINCIQFHQASPIPPTQRGQVHLFHVSLAAYSVQSENGPRGGPVPKGPRLRPIPTGIPAPPVLPQGNSDQPSKTVLLRLGGVKAILPL